jgi:thiol:disulfide interchange protein DsbD
MRKIISAVFSLFITVVSLHAQLLNPIKWSFGQERKNDSTTILIFTATLEKDYHLYSQFTPSGGPLPTLFKFNPSASYKLIGKTKEPKPVSSFDELFGVDVRMFKEEAVTFRQEVKIRSVAAFEIRGEIDGMTCNNKGCIPFDQVPFLFRVEGRKIKVEAQEKDSLPLVISDTLGSADKTPPETTVKKSACSDYLIEGLHAESKQEEQKSYWLIFLLGIGGGLLALLTPCVFPMIPLTVSFFTKNAASRRRGLIMASLYGLSIALIYTLLAVPFVVAKIPPDTLNAVATNAILNLVFFVIFVVFAISFFGYFEISLPSSLANKADKASNVGGLIGVFFMAIVLAIVSFSCTGPILGTFLAGTLATNPDPYNILFVMLGFGVALGLPFALFAAFPAWLNTLPKSGGWLNSVKVVLGFLELALAVKFLSNADLVEQWGLLKRETFLYVWSLLAFALALYILGVFRFPHDNPVKKRGVLRITLSAFFITCGIYFTAGVFGANLQLISGFPPPLFYSYESERHAAASGNAGDVHCPQGIPCENDFEKARERAARERKPLLIDFTGWACVNCRRMEEGVWIDPEVKKIMSQDYILVSLYVDEKRELPPAEKFVSCYSGKRVETVGAKWSNLQLVNFKANAQPYYVLLSPDMKVLNAPVGYTGRDEFLKFLQEGIDNSKNLRSHR